ncbi:GNAT family N-acetyltransferase [Pseudomonas sp.]|uniref:GNAT family N-acetyltransferase n=1 Tax=Pseudomonas sp. TaxID=306 RepID=UPI003D0A8322
MTRPVEIGTERLHLRQWRESDRGPFAEMSADARVMEFFPSLLDRTASDAIADRCQTLIAERGWGFWATELKETREFIGFVGLHEPAAELPFSPCVEVGWRLAYAHWGKGLATEAARAALGFGFDELALEEIVSFTAAVNARSRRVMQRLGMSEADTFVHPAIPVGHPLREHCLYRLSRKRWAHRTSRR